VPVAPAAPRAPAPAAPAAKAKASFGEIDVPVPGPRFGEIDIPMGTRAAPPPARPAPAPAKPTAPVARPAPVPPPAPPAAAKPAPAPAVAAPAAAPRAQTEADLGEGRIRQIYAKYVETRRSTQESTAGVTYEKLAASLRAQADKLKASHPNRSVDYEVVIKDGKTHLKPVLR
jgi:hypothetical protein